VVMTVAEVLAIGKNSSAEVTHQLTSSPAILRRP
jgi:hypothetical protein